jgi:multiple sugar transport system permease protein
VTGKQAKELAKGLAFASPWIVGFLVFTAYAIAASLYFSFCRYDILSPPQWIGLKNYSRLLLDDEVFRKSLWSTMYMVVFGLPVGLVASLAVALLLNAKVKGIAIYRTIFYVPSLVPAVALATLWMWLFNTDIGLINVLLRKVGIAGPGWLTDPLWSKPALILMGLWGAGGSAIIYLAGLQGIPDHLYEAADLDGAGVLSKFRHVTLPMLSPVIFFNLIMGLIGSFQYFTQVYIMTGGGPQDSTLFYALYLFNRAFMDLKMGYASAMAWILFVITLVCTLIVFKTSAKWVYYEGEKAA